MTTKSDYKEATIISIQEIGMMTKRLPSSWTQAAGLLSHRRKALQGHLQTVRL